ncbi:MAG TPA: hypothetical protein VK619_01885 [Pyrinomonadaceae bacterium]|nr:hypothetical protein [Pyrinomonadaceae bacterium]
MKFSNSCIANHTHALQARRCRKIPTLASTIEHFGRRCQLRTQVLPAQTLLKSLERQ